MLTHGNSSDFAAFIHMSTTKDLWKFTICYVRMNP